MLAFGKFRRTVVSHTIPCPDCNADEKTSHRSILSFIETGKVSDPNFSATTIVVEDQSQ